MQSNRNLITSPLEWVHAQQAKAKYNSYVLIGMFVGVTVLAALITFIILMIVQLGKLDASTKDSAPAWFSYVPLFGPAILTFFGAIIAAVAMQTRYRMAFKYGRYIRSELLLFEHGLNEYAKSNADREILLANKVATLIGFAKE